MKYTITETEKQTLFTHDVEGGKKAYAPRGGFVVLTGGTNPIKKALEKTKLESTLQKKLQEFHSQHPEMEEVSNVVTVPAEKLINPPKFEYVNIPSKLTDESYAAAMPGEWSVVEGESQYIPSDINEEDEVKDTEGSEDEDNISDSETKPDIKLEDSTENTKYTNQ